MTNCNPVKSSCESSVQFHKHIFDEESVDDEFYHQMIDSLMFLAQYTQFNIAYTISALSQFNKDSSIHHIHIIKHLMCYIQAIKDICIVYDDDPDTYPVSHSDKDPDHSDKDSDIYSIDYLDISYANNPDDRKSIFDYIYSYINDIISYQCQKQFIIVMSTMEFEFMNLSEVAKEAIFLLKLLCSLKFNITQSIVININFTIYA